MAVYLAQRYFSKKQQEGWNERWGHLPAATAWRPESAPRLWIHAVSAGEVVAAVPILRELRARLPDHSIFFSVITPAGYRLAQQQASDLTDALFYFPFDLPWVVRRVVRQVRPDVFVSLESELWPNLLHELRAAGAATALVNGRISEQSFRRIQRYGKGLFRWMLSQMDRLLMQSTADAGRVGSLMGDRAAAGRVQVIGNAKFDQENPALTHEQTCALRSALKLPDEAPVLVAGSTRSPEEEAILLEAYHAMRACCPELCLLVAPRHIDRASQVAEAMRAAGLSPVRKTELGTTQGPVRHLILDTMGELAQIYAVASVAFVGNTFGPVVNGGGQNLLQPLAHGKPTLFGPHIATIRSEAALALEAGVGFQAADAEEFARLGASLLQDSGRRAEIVTRAQELVASNRGAAMRYADAVAELAGRRRSAGQPVYGRRQSPRSAQS